MILWDVCCVKVVAVIVWLLLLLYYDLVLYHLHVAQCLYFWAVFELELLVCLCISSSMLVIFGGTDQTIAR